MTEASNRLVQKLWSYCQVLRDDGLSYQDYLEQLTFLLFLKMADEREKLPARRTGCRGRLRCCFSHGDTGRIRRQATHRRDEQRFKLQRHGHDKVFSS